MPNPIHSGRVYIRKGTVSLTINLESKKLFTIRSLSFHTLWCIGRDRAFKYIIKMMGKYNYINLKPTWKTHVPVSGL